MRFDIITLLYFVVSYGVVSYGCGTVDCSYSTGTWCVVLQYCCCWLGTTTVVLLVAC